MELDNGLCTRIPDFFYFYIYYVYFPFIIGKLIWENFAFVVHFRLFRKFFFFCYRRFIKALHFFFLFILGDLCCLCHTFCFEFSLNVHAFGHFPSSIGVPRRSKCTEPELPRAFLCLRGGRQIWKSIANFCPENVCKKAGLELLK